MLCWNVRDPRFESCLCSQFVPRSQTILLSVIPVKGQQPPPVVQLLKENQRKETFYWGAPIQCKVEATPIRSCRAEAAGHLGTCSPPCRTRGPGRHRGGGGGRATWLVRLRLRGQVGQDGCGAWHAGLWDPTRNRAG